jgi:ATP-dependent Lhr-like helicase
VLKAMEDAGRVRRGYFVAGLGAAQFALPGTEDRLRALRADPSRLASVQMLAATDPANPYGASVPWPVSPPRFGTAEEPESEPRLQRVAGARVILQGGALVGYVSRTETGVWVLAPEQEPERSRAFAAVSTSLAELVDGVERRALLVETVNGVLTERSPLAPALVAAGFSPGPRGYQLIAASRSVPDGARGRLGARR